MKVCSMNWKIFLIESDVGVDSAKELREKFANTKINPKNSSKNEIFRIFSNYVSEILKTT